MASSWLNHDAYAALYAAAARRLDLTRLRVIDALARLGSVTAAAKALHYSQPTVSHHLARLEAETGARLLQRVGRRTWCPPERGRRCPTSATPPGSPAASGAAATSWRSARTRGSPPRIGYTSEDMVVMQALVVAGLGVTTQPGPALRAHRIAGIEASELPGAHQRVDAATYGDPPATSALLAALAAAAAPVRDDRRAGGRDSPRTSRPVDTALEQAPAGCRPDRFS